MKNKDPLNNKQPSRLKMHPISEIKHVWQSLLTATSPTKGKRIWRCLISDLWIDKSAVSERAKFSAKKAVLHLKVIFSANFAPGVKRRVSNSQDWEDFLSHFSLTRQNFPSWELFNLAQRKEYFVMVKRRPIWLSIPVLERFNLVY